MRQYASWNGRAETGGNSLKVRFLHLQIPPDLPGVRKHLPDVAHLDSAKGLSSRKIQFHGHLYELGLLLGSERQKLDIECIAVDLP